VVNRCSASFVDVLRSAGSRHSVFVKRIRVRGFREYVLRFLTLFRWQNFCPSELPGGKKRTLLPTQKGNEKVSDRTLKEFKSFFVVFLTIFLKNQVL
jgi:hypothetical protein